MQDKKDKKDNFPSVQIWIGVLTLFWNKSRGFYFIWSACATLRVIARAFRGTTEKLPGKEESPMDWKIISLS
jgi:hypothetical protein